MGGTEDFLFMNAISLYLLIIYVHKSVPPQILQIKRNSQKKLIDLCPFVNFNVGEVFQSQVFSNHLFLNHIVSSER